MFVREQEFKGHSAGIYSLAFDGKFVYSASADKFVVRWDTETGLQDKFAIRFNFPVYAISLFENNQFLAVGLYNGDLHFFDLELRKEIKFLKHHNNAIFSLCYNAVKKHLYSADADGNIAVWDTSSLSLLLNLPINCGKIRTLSIDSKGKYLAAGGQNGKMYVFDTEFFNEKLAFHAHKDGVGACIFNPEHNNIIYTAGKDAYIRKWDLNTNELISEIPAHNYMIYDLILAEDDQKLVSASRDKTIKIWDPENLSFVDRLDQKRSGHKHSVNTLIKINESSFASASDDKKILVWKNVIKQ